MIESIARLWPLRTLDFEASSLEDGGYPIEVGIAVWPSHGEPISSWSALIRPLKEWEEDGHWDEHASLIHGIDTLELVDAETPTAVAKALNVRLGAGTVWCDALEFDRHWMGMLFEAGNIKPAFELRSWQALLRELPDPVRYHAMEWIERTLSSHRAEGDARALLRAIAFGFAERE
ncbi:hypothetical protein [Aquabacter cavernae]|uniref:3'-5' exonuclease n=1 Tax=Aquabacter cavernae TaxID=2496029 RepID=UPI000F8C791F|nr:hypothetical protein [Aquabacter cavernae]